VSVDATEKEMRTTVTTRFQLAMRCTGVSVRPLLNLKLVRVVVYYDSEDPRSNALEDFSEKSRETRRFLDISVLVLAAIVVFILWHGPPRREIPDEPNP
jgi:hypothetical protein